MTYTDLQTPSVNDDVVVSQGAPGATRLEPMLIRLPPLLATQLRQLARATRVRQSDYLREAVADLIAKYGVATHGYDAAAPADHS
jgi:hypothetical protein